MPNVKSEVFIKPDVDSVLQLTGTTTIDKLHLSTANAAVTIKGAALVANSVDMVNAQAAHQLTLDACVLGSRSNSAQLKMVEQVDLLSKLKLVNESGIYLGSSLNGTEVTLYGEDWLHSGSGISQICGVLRAGRGISVAMPIWGMSVSLASKTARSLLPIAPESKQLAESHPDLRFAPPMVGQTTVSAGVSARLTRMERSAPFQLKSSMPV